MNVLSEKRKKMIKDQLKKITDVFGMGEIATSSDFRGGIEAKNNQQLQIDLEKLKSYYQKNNLEIHTEAVEKIQELEWLKRLFYGYHSFKYTVSCYIPEVRARLLQEMSLNREKEKTPKDEEDFLNILLQAGYQEEVAKIRLVAVFDKVQENEMIEKIIEDMELEVIHYENLIEDYLARKIAEIADEL